MSFHISIINFNDLIYNLKKIVCKYIIKKKVFINLLHSFNFFLIKSLHIHIYDVYETIYMKIIMHSNEIDK